MTDNMKKLYEEVANDAAFAEKINGAESLEAVLALAKEKGIELTDADLVLEAPTGELPDDALDDVAGGVSVAGSIAAGSVTAGSIAAGSIAAGSSAAGSIVAGSIAAGSIAAGSSAAGSIAAGSIAAGSIAAGAQTKLHDLLYRARSTPQLTTLPHTGAKGTGFIKL